MPIQIKKAVRERVYLKLVVCGASGSGKTFGALGIAKGLAPTGKVLVVDTENRSASYYAGRWDFDVVELEAPFTTQKYNEALQAALDNGYEVVVIDSLTHEWAGSGGLQDQKAQKDARGGNSFTNWQEQKMAHNKFTEKLLQSHIHVVGTLRSKMSYVLEENDKGKQTPRKVGMAPISADDMEYEFGVMFDVERNTHLAIASKDRTGLFEGKNLNLDETVGRELRAWLESGAQLQPAQASAPVSPAPAPAKAPEAARPTRAPVAASTGATSSNTQATTPPSEPELPAEWVTAMVELTEATLGMPEQTRRKLIADFEAEGPGAIADLRKEIATIRKAMVTPEPKSAGAAIASLPPIEKAPISQAASDFVDGVSPALGDTDEANGGISQDQYEALNQLIGAFGINRDALRSYCFKAGHLLPGKNGPTLARMTASYFGTLRDKLCNKKIAAGKETWSARTVRIINSTPITTFQPISAAS